MLKNQINFVIFDKIMYFFYNIFSHLLFYSTIYFSTINMLISITLIFFF